MFQNVSRVQIEGGRSARVRPSELGVAPVAHRHFFEPLINDEVDERGAAEDAVGDQVAAEPVEAGADRGADGDDSQSDFGIEVFARVEIGAGAQGTSIDRPIVANRLADRQGNAAAAAAARDGTRRVDGGDGTRRVGGGDGKSGVTLWTLRENLQA